MDTPKVAIIGCGNLGRALIEGWLQAGYPAASLIATRRNTSALEDLRQKGVEVTADNAAAAGLADIVLLAVKPYNMEPVLRGILPALGSGDKVLVSAATGFSLAEMQALAPSVPVFRVMPNTAAAVGESVTCFCGNDPDGADGARLRDLFGRIGLTVAVDEKLMEAATILGACGIAYVMRFIRAMVQGGIQIGFDAKTASDIAYQTVSGASRLLIESGNHPEEEIDKVTTPRGCTIVGLNEMEHQGFSSSLIRGIVASFREIED